VLGGEERGEEPAGVLGEGEHEEAGVALGEGLLGVGGRSEEGVDPGEELGPDLERRLLDAGGVQPQQGSQQDVEEDRAGGRVRRRNFGCGARDWQAAVEAVGEERRVPPALHEAGAQDRAEVREGAQLGRVGPREHQSSQREAQADAAVGHGCGEEVRVDLGLGVVVEGEGGVQPGDFLVELGGAGDELGLRGGG